MNKILVIDDDEYVRDSVSLFLENAGYSVVEGATSEEGFENLQGTQASAVITDIGSLSHDGQTPFQKIRKRSPKFPIIALSGTMSHFQNGGNPIPNSLQPTFTLQKPFTVDELLEVIQRALLH
ncbi:MAG: response regulator [Nitrospirales bacterium]|nr:response regulator [Nitrospirales bacterium]